jgi:hypothetical protein
MPEQIDSHQQVPLPEDSAGRASCPRCNSCLLELENHQRIVEDLIPAKVVVTCYHTRSGWCPGCRKRIESRASEQPPAANLPHGQLELNALATGALLLKGRWNPLSDERYTLRVCRLEDRLDQLADADYDEPNAKRIGKRMRKFKKELTAFLLDKNLEGTNNIAERAIRPLVVARKITGGSRSEKGADAFATLASLLRTADQQGKNTLATIKSLLIAAGTAGNPAVS